MSFLHPGAGGGFIGPLYGWGPDHLGWVLWIVLPGAVLPALLIRGFGIRQQRAVLGIGAAQRIVGVRIDRSPIDFGEAVPGKEVSVEGQGKQPGQPLYETYITTALFWESCHLNVRRSRA